MKQAILILVGSVLGSLVLTVGVSAHGHSQHCIGSPDINGDGVVNIQDLSILLSHYGQKVN